MLTVHGRTREMKGIMTGLADWSQIKAVKEAVSVPVYANGNIQFVSNVDDCLTQTGADGVMAAEVLLHNPAFFSARHVPCWRLCEQYLQLCHKHPTHLSNIRAHLFKMLHHVLQLPENVGLRDAVSKSKAISDLNEFVDTIRRLYVVENEDQSLEMTTLPVPVYLSQPMFRIDRVLGPSRQVAQTKRPVTSEANSGGSKKRKKSGKEDRIKKLELCVKCKNPRGLRCPLLRCRTCCLREGPTIVCENHNMRKKENKSIGHDV